ncbi:hypothetical protein [Rhodococcus sp. ACS1]|uniref:hypothetical protein n=1 Tax=Rhodococcus sp. ACS1 TaxID=2028570 RepID=UPI001179ED16|nr:hypothetical protein [Rhodococcus sp. ACS1]
MRGRVERWDPRPGDGFRMVLIYLDDTERLHPQAWAAPVTSDRHETEGQFSFDVPVCDPAGDLFVRLALVVRHFVATGYFTRGSNAFDPPGSTGHVTRTPVVVLRTEDDDRHTTRLALPGSSVAMRRRRPGSNLQWSGPFG